MNRKSLWILTALMIPAILLQAQNKKYVTAKDMFYAELKSPAAPVQPAVADKRPVVPTGPSAGKVPAVVNSPPSNSGGTSITRPTGGNGVTVANRVDTAPSRKAGLRYELIQQTPDGREAVVDPESTFRSGDRVRFAFESSIDGYLYVMQEGSSGRETLLFPKPNLNEGRVAVRRGEKHFVPSRDQWFKFDNTPGTERLTVYLSKSPEKELPGYSAPITTIASIDRSIVDGLRGKVNTRDLVFETEKPPSGGSATALSTFVVNAKETGTAVLFSITLKHR